MIPKLNKISHVSPSIQFNKKNFFLPLPDISCLVFVNKLSFSIPDKLNIILIQCGYVNTVNYAVLCT